MLHHNRLRDFFCKIGIFGIVLGIFAVAFVRALSVRQSKRDAGAAVTS